MEKEIKITPPEGFEIDKENSTFECIKFKPIVRWRDLNETVSGYSILAPANPPFVLKHTSKFNNDCIFATKKQAKSALAMAKISQIIANDKRFGGVVTEKEHADASVAKYIIFKNFDGIKIGIGTDVVFGYYANYLTFHTCKQRDLFLEENRDLVIDYLMIGDES